MKKSTGYIVSIVISIIVILVAVVTLINVFKPKPDYYSYNIALNNYLSQYQNIKEYVIEDNGILIIKIDDSSWVKSTKIEKSTYCQNINSNITKLALEYRIISKQNSVMVYYYNQNGVQLAKPKTLSFESEILY